MVYLDVVEILEQRLEFLEGIEEVAKSCNWPPRQIQELRSYLLDEVIRIDNLMFEVYEKTEDRTLAYLVWEGHMEDLRRWLGMVFGIRVKFV